MPENNSLKVLASFSTSAICDAIETFNVRLRNEGHIDGGIINRVANKNAMVGYAITLKVRTDKPPVQGLSYRERNDWWDIFAKSDLPKIIVIEDVSKVNSGSVAGKVHGSIFKALGAVGLITNGSVRNVDDFADMKLPLYSSGVCASHSYSHIIEVGTAVNIGGLQINNGDLLHGDKNGVVKIPPSIIDDIPAVVKKITNHQNKFINFCASSKFSISKLRRMANLFNR